MKKKLKEVKAAYEGAKVWTVLAIATPVAVMVILAVVVARGC